MENFKSQKQIADELGIDKQKIYRYIKKNNICEAVIEASTLMYSEKVVNTIKSHFSNTTASSEALHEAVEALQKVSDEAPIEAVTSVIESHSSNNATLSEAVEAPHEALHEAVIEVVEALHEAVAEAPSEAPVETTNQVLISMLQKELDEKNKLISNQQKIIENLTDTIHTQAQSINAINHRQLAEQLTNSNQPLIEDPKPRKGWFRSLLHKS